MLIPKACAFMGFALREHDITWRTGIIFLLSARYSR